MLLENSSQPRRGTPKPLSPAEKSQDDASEAALLLGLHHDGMWLRETPPASPCTSTVHRSVPWMKGAALGSSRCVGCHNCLHGWLLTSAFSSFCPSYSPNHPCHLSEIPGHSFMGRCWLWVKQCWYFWTAPGWKRQHQQCVGLQTEGTTTTEAGWDQGNPNPELNTGVIPGLEEWRDGHSQPPWETCSSAGLLQGKDFYPYVKAHGWGEGGHGSRIPH